jgi:pimeloyl-ACP methyl ester carboxylesterase
VIGLSPSAAALRAQEVKPAAQTQLVQFDGRPVRVQAYGLDGRRAGSPVVVFEAGATNAIEVWGGIPGRVALEAPVIAYDRAGLGRSAWDSTAPSPQHVTDRLRRLLQQVGVAPPYVLVGYSWGGMLARYYAGYYPADVAGLVLVDPSPVLTLSRTQHVAPFDSVGAGRAGYDAYWSGFGALFGRSAPAVRAEFDVFRGLVDADLPQRDLRPLPSVPLAIIVAARYLDIPGMRLPYDPRAHFEVDLRQRTRELERWAFDSRQGTLVVSNHTTHAIPREDPDVIVWAVQRVLRAVRAR